MSALNKKIKCEICGCEVDALSNRQKYCKPCSIAVTKIQSNISARVSQHENQEIWDEMPEEQKLFLMNKASILLLNKETIDEVVERKLEERRKLRDQFYISPRYKELVIGVNKKINKTNIQDDIKK